MLIGRCAWHRMYHGYVKFLGVVSWRGWSVQFTDGMCPTCAHRLRSHWRRESPRFDRVQRPWGYVGMTPLRASGLFVALPLTTALVLAAVPLHDVPIAEVAGPAAASIATGVRGAGLCVQDGAVPPARPRVATAMRTPVTRRRAEPPPGVIREPGVIWEPRAVRAPGTTARTPRPVETVATREERPDVVHTVVWSPPRAGTGVRRQRRTAPTLVPPAIVASVPGEGGAQAPQLRV